METIQDKNNLFLNLYGTVRNLVPLQEILILPYIIVYTL